MSFGHILYIIVYKTMTVIWPRICWMFYFVQSQPFVYYVNKEVDGHWFRSCFWRWHEVENTFQDIAASDWVEKFKQLRLWSVIRNSHNRYLKCHVILHKNIECVGAVKVNFSQFLLGMKIRPRSELKNLPDISLVLYFHMLKIRQ